MATGVNYRHIMLTVVLTSIIFITIWLLSGVSFNRYSTYKIFTKEHVSGLLIDAPVEYKGVDVGKVKSIELKGTQGVEILLNVKRTTPITQGTVAIITTRGLTTRGFTGFVYIALKDTGTKLQPLAAQPGETFPVIPTEPSTALSLDTTLIEMNKHLQHVTELFQSVLDKENIGSLKDLLTNLNDVTSMLADNSQKLEVILVNTEKASYHFEPFFNSSQNTMKILETQTLPLTYRVLSDLDPFLKSGQGAMTLLEAQTLPAIYRALSHLDDVSNKFITLTNQIQQDPSMLIRGTTPPPPGPGEINENE